MAWAQQDSDEESPQRQRLIDLARSLSEIEKLVIPLFIAQSASYLW